MNEKKQDELEVLRAEMLALRTQLSASELDIRLTDRDREYQQRIASLDKAACGVMSENAAADAHFVQLLALVKAVVAQIHTQGYAIVPNLLDATQVERVRNGMAPLFAVTRRMFEKIDPQKPRLPFHIHNVFAKSRAADEVAVNPLIRTIVGGVLGHDFILHAGAVAMSPDPGCSAQELHRDDGSYALLPRPRLPLVVTAAVALDDFTKKNGATQIVPGSCCWPSSRRPQPDEVIQCEMPAGSVLLWDGAIFHGGGANITTDQTRRTLTFNYTRGWLRTQYNQFLSLPREVVLSLPPELQRDLGYHLSARGLGACDNQDPLAYLRRMFSNGGDGSQFMLGEEMENQ